MKSLVFNHGQCCGIKQGSHEGISTTKNLTKLKEFAKNVISSPTPPILKNVFRRPCESNEIWTSSFRFGLLRFQNNHKTLSRTFLYSFEVFASFLKFSDMLGPVRMHSDAFGCIRMHRDLDALFFFLIPTHLKVNPPRG